MLMIKILGSGCKNCKQLEKMTREAAASLPIECAFEKVTDYADIMQYNVLATPGLVINETLVAAGRIPGKTEITTWLNQAAAETAS